MPESSSDASAQPDDVSLRVDGAASTCDCVMVVRIAGHQRQLPNAADRWEIADLQALAAEVVRIAQFQCDGALLEDRSAMKALTQLLNSGGEFSARASIGVAARLAAIAAIVSVRAITCQLHIEG
jgi:hypothetical protein